MSPEEEPEMNVVELRVDAAIEPIIDRRRPRLSWIVKARGEGRLEGFHVVVATSPEDVARGVGSQWDSGERREAATSVFYDGPPLRSRASYWWGVRVLISGRWSAWSSPSRWTMALLEPGDWAGAWIGRADPPPRLTLPVIGGEVAVAPGEIASQAFRFAEPIGMLSADVSPVGAGVEATLTLTRREDSVVIARWPLDDSWGRYYSWWAPIDEPVPGGDYVLELAVSRGRATWSRAQTHEGEDALALVVGGTDRGGYELVRDIDIDRPVRAAHLYGVGLGYHEVTINGRRVGRAVLDPAVTDYRARVLYNRHDVTPALEVGRNSIEIVLGNGYFHTPSANIWGWHAAPWAHDPVARFQLEVEYEDGETVVVATDASWQTRASSTVRDSLYEGETWRPLEPSRDRQAARIVEGPGGVMRYQYQPPIVPRDLGSAVAVREIGHDSILLDAGRTLTGWIRLSCRARPGSSIEILYGERTEDALTGVVNGFIAGRPQVDVVEVPDDGVIVGWEPRFTYKGFRYVRVSGSEVSDLEVSVVAAHSAVDRVGAFESPVEIAAWIDAATERTLLNNLMGIPTDTPVHEKNGWTGDGHLIAEAAMYAFDLNLFYRKWLDDFRDSQDESGSIPVIVPTPGWGTPVCPVFSGAYPILLWDHYRHYADREVLSENLDGVLAYSRHLIRALGEKRIWTGYSWGDWMSPGNDYAPEGPALTGTAFCYEAIRKTMWAARVLGRHDLVVELESELAAIAEAFSDAFLDRELMVYRTRPGESYRQASNVFPLAFGMVPSDARQAVADNLARDVHVTRDDHLDTGAPSTRYLLHVLAETGHADVAVSVLTQTTYPSWGFWRAQGGDTLWEKWGLEARSRNHYFFGAVSQWIRERVGGLAIASPGGSDLICDPVIDPRVPSGSVTLQTVHGTASARWARVGRRVEAWLTVPFGARVHLPDGSVAVEDTRVDWLTE